jgi:NitT/TauT family transport system substrate-binding protein
VIRAQILRTDSFFHLHSRSFMQTRNWRGAGILAATSILLLAAAGLALLPVGCGSKPKPAEPGEPIKIKIAYLGLTCEAPIFVAHEKGMYQEEGLDVELVKTDWNGLRQGLATGNYDANHTLVMYLLQAIENNADLKITGGIHTGCLRVLVGAKSGIATAADLKGKKIGVPTHIGSPPYMFACRVVAAAGIDPSPDAKQVTWLPFPPDVLGKALEDGRIDALTTTDPIGTILIGKGQVRVLADQAKDAPYAEEYCCATVVSGKLAKKNPVAAAKVTRAMLKGAKWVEENPKAAAELAVEKSYISASAEINTQALAKLKYVPGVSKCKRSVEQAAEDMKRARLLKDSTDPVALAKRAWIDLEGVTDEWTVALKVDRVEGGGRPVLLSADRFAALFDHEKACCACCCVKDAR